ncbi:UNVERIFIED_CONTAM: Tryptophan synthase beta chain 2 [Sesamum angustifolium]|uniref:tryptophan synthase n=1 Tax=Sesamum angustifolium TaxID=2727405 RepID=A0AAW2NIL3_9LAMI
MAQSIYLSSSANPKFSFKGDGQFLGRFVPKKTPCRLRLLSNSRVAPRAAYPVDSRAIEIPRRWYNLIADLPVKPPPPLNPKTFEPVKPEDLSPLFPDELIKQEVTDERFIDIPEEVIDVYRLWRPTPLIRAKRLEKLLDTPARIYYKYEGVSPAGSHKPNTAVPQVWYNAQQGVKNVVTETGAGQWGSSLAFACSLFGLNCEVWQVRASYDQKPYRKLMMQTWGAKVHPSPSTITAAGRRILEQDPLSPGSLGIAISEAVEVAATNADTKYCLGSVLNHMEAIGETPDVIIGCTGGGSNFGGLAFPFIREKLSGKINPLIRAVEPAACPSLTKGVYAYDYGDTAGMTPLMKMHTLGHDFIPDPIHAGGLRYHGMAPLISHVYELGFMETISFAQTECFAGAIQFARSEGLIPAPEPTHAIAATIREALHCRETGESKVILMAMCGHGHFDLPAYEKYLQGDLVDLSFSEEKIKESLAKIPQLEPKLTVSHKLAADYGKQRSSTPPHLRRPLPVPGIVHPDPYASAVRPPLGVFPPFEMLPPHEVMEQKLSAQHIEIEKLATENRRLAATHGTLRQDLATAKHDLQLVHAHIADVKSEKEQQMSGLIDKMSMMESELEAAESIKTELQQARAEAQSLVSTRQELISKVQQLTRDLQSAHSEAQQIPSLMAELESLRQEYQHCRATYDYEKKLYNDHLESLQVMEKNYAAMSREVDKLRAELANSVNFDPRIRGPYGSSAGYNRSVPGGNYASAQNAYGVGQQGQGPLPGGGSGGGPAGAAGPGGNSPHVGVHSTPYGSGTQRDATSAPGYGASRGTGYDPHKRDVGTGYDAQKGHAGTGYDAQRVQTGTSFDSQRGSVGPGYDAHRGPTSSVHNTQRGPGYEAMTMRGPRSDTQKGPGYEIQRTPGYDARKGSIYDGQSAPAYDMQRASGDEAQRGSNYDAQKGASYDASSRGIVGPQGQVSVNNVPYSSTPSSRAGTGYESVPRGANPVRR